MKRRVIALLVAAGMALSACVVVAPPQDSPKGGPGNDYCPPGQAKKGNC
jgi:hypothetical protein